MTTGQVTAMAAYTDAQRDDYRARAQWRKAIAMAHLLYSFPVRAEPHELLLYGDDEWLQLQQAACHWLRDATKPPSATTRDLAAAEYLRLYHGAGTDPFPTDDEE